MTSPRPDEPQTPPPEHDPVRPDEPEFRPHEPDVDIVALPPDTPTRGIPVDPPDRDARR
jgi:hypothetical protein